MKRIYIYLILLITVSSFIVPCSCLDTSVLPEKLELAIENDSANNQYLEFLQNSKYYILMYTPYNRTQKYRFIFSSSPINVKTSVSYGSTYYDVYSDEDTLYMLDFLDYNSNDTLYKVNGNCFKYEPGKKFMFSVTEYTFEQSNIDIINSETGDIYYTVPTILEVATKDIRLDRVLNEVVNLLPVVLVVVVGLIGIRKGIRFVRSNLIKS